MTRPPADDLLASERRKRWQAKKRAAGLCAFCGKGQLVNGWECQSCRDARLAKQRARTGHKPWRPGGPGRPPTRLT